ncbi:MAG: DUF222 domain-containing protein [Gammaproteobacteria bacterium]|nr:DUF222 domain-containing protein [Gammaproteobacteria bacterium]
MDGEFSTLSTPELVDEITTLAGHLNAANARFLALIGELDRRRGWAEWGVKSCAHWLNWKCGIDLGAAREKVRVASALVGLPRVAAAMAEGRISYAKVRAVTRVADAGNEGYLLNIALHGTASHVEDVVRGYRRALDAAELTREAVQHRDQHLWFHTEPDGSMVIRGRVPAEIGALFRRALEAALDSLPIPKDVSAETSFDDLHRSRTRRVEALAVLAESFLANGPKDLSGADRQQIVVHVDVETFQHRCAGRCELEHGPSLAAETARRLACDASVVRILENERGEPLDVGRKTRTIPPGIRRALNARDKGCRFPGCTFKRYVDGHHVRHWAEGGETKLSNLGTLCRFHHRLVHEGQFAIQTLDDSAFRFVQPSGESFDSPLPAPTDGRAIVVAHKAAHLDITPTTAITRWTGEALDLGLAVDILMQRRGKDVSAETSQPIRPP